MDRNIIGLAFSFFFVFSIIAAASVLERFKLLSNEGTRKFIHIGVSNWWILAMIYFDNRSYASIVPSIFIILNYLSYRMNLVKAMEREGNKNDLGTVYYPIALLVLVLLTFSRYSHPYVGALGILIMGYGDGLAAIIGKKFGKHQYHILRYKKSIEGSLTMFVASLLVGLLLLNLYSPEMFLLKAIIMAGIATILEAFSPYGLDNLTVPILVSGFYQILFYR